MVVVRSLLSLVFFLNSTPNLQTQSPAVSTTVVREVQAVGILQTTLAALGGPVQSQLASISASGTYTQFLADSNTSSFPLRVKVLGYDQFRWEVDTPDQGTVVTIVSGTMASRQTSSGTEAVTLSQIPGTTYESFPALYISQWLTSPAISVKLIGSESLAGNSVYHLSITPTLVGNTDASRETRYETTQQREIFIDEKTNLPVDLRYNKHPNDWRNAIPADVQYSTFQVIGGVSFPETISTFLGGDKLTEIHYSQISLNAAISPSDFAGGLQ
jgi:outer membrane lipoprotein-sorting protein